MPFETERDAILFTIRMGLMHCRTSPKPERNERVQRIQAEAVLSHLERCGYRIVFNGYMPAWWAAINRSRARIASARATLNFFQARGCREIIAVEEKRSHVGHEHFGFTEEVVRLRELRSGRCIQRLNPSELHASSVLARPPIVHRMIVFVRRTIFDFYQRLSPTFGRTLDDIAAAGTCLYAIRCTHAHISSLPVARNSWTQGQGSGLI